MSATPSTEYTREVGRRLRALRKAAGWSLLEAERLSGGKYKAVVLGSYERADRGLTVDKLPGLAAFYGVEVADLLPPPQVPPTSPLVTATFAAITAAKDAEQLEMAAAYERRLGDLEHENAELRASLTGVAL